MSAEQLPVNIPLPHNAVWLVTGTSSGIGHALITTILSTPGHRIAALSRNPSSIPLPSISNSDNTLLVPVDLTSSSSIEAAFKTTVEKFGRIDVVINNAGFGLSGELEGTDIAKARELFEINFWAPLIITQQALDVMRNVNPHTGSIGGVIAQVSSIGGFAGFPGRSIYHATKFALEGLTESASKELSPAWNTRFVIFEPGSVKTKWSNANQVDARDGKGQHPDYRGKGLATDQAAKNLGTLEGKIGAEAGDVAQLMTDVLIDKDEKWVGQGLLRLPLGADAWALCSQKVDSTRESFDKWRETSESTSGPEVKVALREFGFLKD